MRILVIRPGALGDALLTLPALQALRSAVPAAEIELMGNLGVLRWLLGRSVVSAVSSFDRAALGALFQVDSQPTDGLRGYLGEFDWIVSYATPLEHVFAQNLLRFAPGRVVCFDARPRDSLQIHMSTHLQMPLRELGIDTCKVSPLLGRGNEPPRISLTLGDQQAAGKWWTEQELDSSWVVAVHPGSGSPAKNWPAQRFAAVAQHLQRERGARVLLVSGPADNRPVAEVQAAVKNGRCILLDSLPLECLAAILARCKLYLGNDSGVSHLAAAVGTPAGVIFGPTDPAVWSPRGAEVQVLQAKVPCAPCSDAKRRQCPEQVCLQGLSVDTVLTALSAVH